LFQRAPHFVRPLSRALPNTVCTWARPRAWCGANIAHKKMCHTDDRWPPLQLCRKHIETPVNSVSGPTAKVGSKFVRRLIAGEFELQRGFVNFDTRNAFTSELGDAHCNGQRHGQKQ
jgi:hypothetical protein